MHSNVKAMRIGQEQMMNNSLLARRPYWWRGTKEYFINSIESASRSGRATLSRDSREIGCKSRIKIHVLHNTCYHNSTKNNKKWKNIAMIKKHTYPHTGKYQPKMIKLCDWSFETKVIIVFDSFFRKPISVHYAGCLNF